MKQILIIPNIKIHNANALSSPYTIGFPAMTAWLGWMHNLQRQLRQKLSATLSQQEILQIAFKGICVSCHHIKLHTHKDTYNSYIIGTSNPLDKKGERPSFVEEARVSLEVTIAIELENDNGWGDNMEEKVKEALVKIIHQNKIASGDVIKLNHKRIRIMGIDENEDSALNELTISLMPGYCLVSRQELIQTKMDQGETALKSILDYLTVVTELDKKQGDQSMTRKMSKKEQEKGWLVPIPIGYQGLTKPQKIKITRNDGTPHLFAESVLTLGEFIMPIRFNSIEQLFWYYTPGIDNDLYICKNNYKPTNNL